MTNLEQFKWENLQVGDILCDNRITDLWFLIKKTDTKIFLMRFDGLEVYPFEEYETVYWKDTYIALDARPEPDEP